MNSEIIMSFVWGVVLIVGALQLNWTAKRCAGGDIRKTQDMFMTEQGWTRSIFAIPYLGRVADAHAAIENDPNLRQKVIYELYAWSAGSFLLGVVGILDGIRKLIG